jgi:hypothetical protein
MGHEVLQLDIAGGVEQPIAVVLNLRRFQASADL